MNESLRLQCRVLRHQELVEDLDQEGKRRVVIGSDKPRKFLNDEKPVLQHEQRITYRLGESSIYNRRFNNVKKQINLHVFLVTAQSIWSSVQH